MANIISMIVVEIVREDKHYRFEVPFGASYQEAQSAAIEASEVLKELEKQIMEAEEKRKQEQPEVVEQPAQ